MEDQIIENQDQITEKDITALAEIPTTKITSVDRVENALAEFVKDTFSMVNEDYKFNRLLRDELITKMQAGELNASQMVMLYTTDSVNISDRMSKTLSPLMQLFTSKQQAEMAKAQQKESPISTNNINDASTIGAPKKLE